MDTVNSNSALTSSGGEKQKNSTDFAFKKVKKRNEELKPFADIIRAEKGEKNTKEKKRIDHLRNNMIATMIKFIGKKENSQQEILKTFRDDKETRSTRATHPKKKMLKTRKKRVKLRREYKDYQSSKPSLKS